MTSDENPTRAGKSAQDRGDGGPDWMMVGVLGVALVVRVAAVLAFPSLHHPDENFQLFEQAHRLAFGYGIVPWEFIFGIRSPVLPVILASVFRLSAPLVGGPEGYLLVARLLLALSSLVAVAAVYRMGRRTSATHALIAGLVAATWFEIVYFADRPLTDAVATTVLLVGLSVASVPDAQLTWRRLAAIGFCLGLALMLRLQLGPGLFVVALWIGRLQLRARWWPMALGGLIPLVVFGIADRLVWGGFFHSYVAAVQANLFEGVASSFGTAPAGAYARWLIVQWRYAFPVLWALIIVRGRASAMWIVAAIVIIVVHSAIPHKEYRFVFPAFACLVIVAAMGAADLLEMARHRLAPMMHRALVSATALLWVAASAALAFTGTFHDWWYTARPEIMASFALAKAPDLCGVLFYDDWWFATGGYAYLHRDVPFYSFDHRTTPRNLIASSASFNAVVAARSSVPDFAKDFHVQKCFSAPGSEDLCVMRRAGTCTPELAMNAFLAPNMTWPSAVESKAANWTKDPPGRVWRVQYLAGTQIWTRRGDSNVFDVTHCTGWACGGRTLSILRSGDRIMVVRGARPADAVIYLGMLAGTRVSGWHPAGPWHADIEQ